MRDLAHANNTEAFAASRKTSELKKMVPLESVEHVEQRRG